MSRWRTRHRGTQGDRGAAAVEFAIVFVVLLLIIFGIIDFGRLLYVQQSVKAASREGARTAVVATGSGSAVYTAASASGASAASLASGPSALSVDANPGGALDASSTVTHDVLCPPATPGSSVTVTVTVDPFDWFTPAFLFATTVQSVSASTTMRCE